MAYAAEAAETAARSIEQSTRHGAALGMSVQATLAQMQACTVEIEWTVRVPVTYSTLAGRCTDEEEVQVADSESEADRAQAEEVERILRDEATAAALRDALGRAPYGVVQDGGPLGIRGRAIRWPHPCTSCDGAGRTSCGSCGGSGRQSCSSCGGSGSQTETTTDHKGETTTRTVSCSWCFMGRVTCSFCAGSGDVDCGACEASGWQTRSSVAEARIREQRRISAEWAHPALAGIFGGTIGLAQLASDGLGRIVRSGAPTVAGSMAVRRFDLGIPAAIVSIGVGEIREEVFVVGFRPRLQLAQALFDRLLKDDIDRVAATAARLHWFAPGTILRAREAWPRFRENEVLEALLQAAAARSKVGRSRWAGFAWCWRTGSVALDPEALHSDIAGAVSVATIARSLDAADRLVRTSRAVARIVAGAALLLAAGLYSGFAARHVGPFAWIGGSLLGAWTAMEAVGWWLGRPLGALARER